MASASSQMDLPLGLPECSPAMEAGLAHHGWSEYITEAAVIFCDPGWLAVVPIGNWSATFIVYARL
jgi:hypothetical protein